MSKEEKEKFYIHKFSNRHSFHGFYFHPTPRNCSFRNFFLYPFKGITIFRCFSFLLFPSQQRKKKEKNERNWKKLVDGKLLLFLFGRVFSHAFMQQKRKDLCFVVQCFIELFLHFIIKNSLLFPNNVKYATAIQRAFHCFSFPCFPFRKIFKRNKKNHWKCHRKKKCFLCVNLLLIATVTSQAYIIYKLDFPISHDGLSHVIFPSHLPTMCLSISFRSLTKKKTKITASRLA